MITNKINRKPSSEELNARLSLAKEINKKFPFLTGHYRIFSTIQVSPKGEEIGSLGIEITSSLLTGEEITMQVVFNKFLDRILTNDIKSQNDRLRKENKELKIKLNKNGNKV